MFTIPNFFCLFVLAHKCIKHYYYFFFERPSVFKFCVSILYCFTSYLPNLLCVLSLPSLAFKYWSISLTRSRYFSLGLPWWLKGKESACKCRRHRFNPWSGRSPGEGNGNPLQYACLKKKNSMDRGTWQATTHETTKSWAQLSDLTTKITNKQTFPYFPICSPKKI